VRSTNLIQELLANQCAYGARMGDGLAVPLRDDDLSLDAGEAGI
jgi:hypothetical protein